MTAFSAQILPDQNLISRVLIGSASWNTSTFFEVNKIQNSLGNWASFSLYFNQNMAIIYTIFMALTIFLGIYWLFQSPFKRLAMPILILLVSSLVFSFGYSFEPFIVFNRFWLQLPGGYIFRESGKLYLLFQVLIILLMGINLSKSTWQLGRNELTSTKNNDLKNQSRYFGSFIYLGILGLVVTTNIIPFFALSASLNYVQLPKIINYALNNCQGKTLAVLPNDTYITPLYSKTFIVNPFTASKSLNCNLIRPNKVDLSQASGQTIKLDISGKNLLLNNILESYRANLAVQTQNTITLDANKQDQNAQNLSCNLKKLGIELLLVDYSSIDYGFNLQSDLSREAKLLQKDGYYGGGLNTPKFYFAPFSITSFVSVANYSVRNTSELAARKLILSSINFKTRTSLAVKL